MHEAPLPHSRASHWKRIDGVDLLRALAILYVLLNHINMRLLLAHVHYTKGLPADLVTALVWQGQPGVQIFFAVSGFLITSTSIKRWHSLARVDIRNFYLIRFARIAPLLLTLLAVLSLLHALQLRDYHVSCKTGGLPGALWAALTLRVGLLEATRGYLPGSWDILWSLSVEEMFYLFFPLACRLLKRGHLFLLLLASFILLGPFGRTLLTHGNEVWQEYSYFGGMDAIAMGCLTALILSRTRISRRLLPLQWAGGIAIMSFCLLCEPELDALGLEKAGLGMTLLAVGTCMVIGAAAQSAWQAPRLLRPLLAYGTRSYEIYLTHMFVVFGFFNLFVRFGKPLHLVPVLFAVTILVSGLLGELVARFFSEPANRWLRSRFGEGTRAVTLAAEGSQSAPV